MNTNEPIWGKLSKSKQYREEFVGALLKRSFPLQVRTLRKHRKMSQEELAEKSGVTQGVISRAEDPDYGNLTFNTVIRIAAGFDLAFIGKFVKFSDFARWSKELSEPIKGLPSFEEEHAELSRKALEIDRIIPDSLAKKASGQDRRGEIVQFDDFLRKPQRKMYETPSSHTG